MNPLSPKSSGEEEQRDDRPQREEDRYAVDVVAFAVGVSARRAEGAAVDEEDPEAEAEEEAAALAAEKERERRRTDTNYNPLLKNGITNRDVSI